jgi:hypothetical protein
MKTVALRKKADAEAAKRQKALAALAVKQTKAVKEQTALAKAKAVLDKASAVMNMDLIQNTAALMGKITDDERIRLKLQQAVLLGNADEAGNLAQQLLASQAAAIKLSATNPLGGFTDALKDALKGVKDLRDELAKLGSAKVGIPSIMQPSTTSPSIFDAGLFPKVTPNLSGVGYDSKSPALTGAEMRIYIDPMAAALGVTAAVIDNAANGNSNGYNSQLSFAGGRGL